MDQAINAGLALSCYARLALHGMLERGVSPGTVLEVHMRMEETVIDLCRGQYLDLHFQRRSLDSIPSLDEYLEMVRLKTGVLLATACEVGALVAGAGAKREAARRFGEALGIAFQFQDDILGVWGETTSLGKPREDLDSRKRSLPVVLSSAIDPAVAKFLARPVKDLEATAALYKAVEAAGARAECQTQLTRTAVQALKALGDLGMPTLWQVHLRHLLQFVAEREA